MTAANQAAKHKPITDAGVKKLLEMVGTIGSSAPGSEERKSYDLAQIANAGNLDSALGTHLNFNS